MPTYDIPALERALENVEDNDVEAHKLYNNLGLAHAANRKYRLALKAHREEKRACKRLVATAGANNGPRLLDLAIAYRRCGDVMLKLDRLVDARNVVIDVRANVIRAANEQHRKGLEIAQSVRRCGVAARVEVQASCAAVAQSALALALETKDRGHFEAAAFGCVEASMLADSLPVGKDGVSANAKEVMLLGISTNMAIAISGLGERAKAKALLHAIAVRAKKANDEHNLVRAIANLAEEAGEEEDWDLCEAYVREWIRLAKKNDDEADESDALRKLATILTEKGRYEEARQALERSLIIASTRQAQDEARHFLNVVEQEIEDRKKSEVELERLEAEASKFGQDGNFVEEAKARMAAGNCAFKLERPEDVARLLCRYFKLVDDYGCDTTVTGVSDVIHNTAVANLGEAMWTMKRYEEAVKWASRELTLFSDDIGGQAQAWCNLGVYLDDYGKRENAIEALKKSVELAQKSGEDEVLKKAQNNLEVIQGSQDATGGEKPNDDLEDELQPTLMDFETPEDTHAELEAEVQMRPQAEPCGPVNEENTVDMAPIHSAKNVGGERSIIIDSSQPMKALNNQLSGPMSDRSQGNSSKRSRMERTNLGVSKMTREVRLGNESSRSQRSRVAIADHSSGGVNKFVDLASEYKRICGKRQHPPVPSRPMIASSLRSLSSILLAREACEEPRNTPDKLDLSALFLNNYDVSVLLETLSLLGPDQRVFLDMRLNPMVTPAAYECLNPRSFASPSALHGIRKIDFSCAGVSGNALLILSDALSEEGSLVNVTHLNVSKNGLGRQGKTTANAVARILFRAAQLEVLDVSLNLLQNSFMPDLIEAVNSTSRSLQGADLSKSPVRIIDLHLNNRQSPTALLEVERPEAIAECFKQLFVAMPGLESVDVRACGGNTEMRRALRYLAAGFPSFSQNIVTVSPAVHDDLS